MRIGRIALSSVIPALAAVFALAAAPAQAQYVFVGSWDLATINGGYGNPANPWIWSNNPISLSARQAAALLFGGSPTDYAISTIDANPANINNRAFVDGWGDSQFLASAASEDFFLQTGTGYNDPGGTGTAYSAYVVDHAPFEGNGSFINYAFRITGNSAGAPEPGTLALLALGAVGFVARRRKA